MSLFGSMQIANNTLFAAQTGLQVTGNNIANANTPGYLRQRVALTPAPTQLIGDLPLGLGVQVDGIMQQSDRFLAERLRGAVSDLSNSETQEHTYVQLESLIGELSETDLSTALSGFFASLNDVLNQPEDIAVRSLAVLQGRTVAEEFRHLDSRVQDLRSQVNMEIAGTTNDINRLLEEVAELNVKIIITEGGSTNASDAVGLRDQRELALGQLADLVGIRVVEQNNGSVTVFAGGDYLVFEGEHRPVATGYTGDQGFALATINLQDTDAPIHISSGKLAGMYAARDEILGGFISQLDSLAHLLASEFNKLHASGQGLTGFSQLISEYKVTDANTALDQVGLAATPVNGSLQVLVRNTKSGIVETTDLFVELNGLKDDTTLSGLVAAIDAVDGVSATVTPENRVSIVSDSSETEFSFAHDSSGVLAALGLNVFFTGSTAQSLNVSSVLREDPSLLGASREGIGEDTYTAELLAGFANAPLEAQSGLSLSEYYENIVGHVAQSSSVTKAVTEGFRVFQRTLEGEHLGISGVSLDDEAVQMITYQRVYQAAARFIGTVSELLETLVNL